MKNHLIYISALLLLLTSCSIHKIDVQQGNVLSKDIVQKVKPGMNRKQVKFLLGNPAIKDPFDKNRWDYPFRYQSGDKGIALKHYHVTVFFAADLVIRVDSNMPDTEITAE